YITGLSGNGKTMMIEQVCASLGRELVRVNITKRTDESDLIGSYELIDGSTVRREGPTITAMRRGAVLLLDECDLGTEDILCLQPILEGKPYFDKKTGEVVHPAPGFTVIATANTKGKGSDDGRFIGTNILNEAFLERFAVTVEQDYPPAATERKILEKNFAELGINDGVFIERLITWAEVIRKSFNDGAVDEVISTRRLVHISKAFSIFNNRLKAIEMCLNRFDTDTKTAFLDLYTKVDADAAAPVKTDEVKIENISNPNTDDLTVRVTKYGKSQTVTITALEVHELRNEGLHAEQIIDRVAKTLIAALDREEEQNDIPF
ncbi:MAG: AAA family ATPase, partial [Chitinophagia bacterium]|nr:AAA family ATPase [Chitinophagia bacterium]